MRLIWSKTAMLEKRVTIICDKQIFQICSWFWSEDRSLDLWFDFFKWRLIAKHNFLRLKDKVFFSIIKLKWLLDWQEMEKKSNFFAGTRSNTEESNIIAILVIFKDLRLIFVWILCTKLDFTSKHSLNLILS